MHITNATHDDGQFILESIVKNASKQHFNPMYITEQGQLGLRDQMISIINNGICPISSEKSIASKIHVAREGKDPIGFVWLMDYDEGNSEIYLCAVAPEYQRKGVAKKLVAESISLYKAGHIVKARVKQDSQGMFKLLKSISFKSRLLDFSKTRTLRFKCS
jgi:ribosomal protein S18 acetylase RimI-like enzyme